MSETSFIKRFDITLDLKQPGCGGDFSVVDGDTGNVVYLALTDAGIPVSGNRALIVILSFRSTLQSTLSSYTSPQPAERPMQEAVNTSAIAKEIFFFNVILIPPLFQTGGNGLPPV